LTEKIEIFRSPIDTKGIAVKYCPECGQENEDDAVYCKRCGTPLWPGAQRVKVKSDLERGIDDFARDIESLGKKIGKEFEDAGRGMDIWSDTTLGVFGPLIWSLVGLVVLFLIIGALWFIGNSYETFEDIGDFLLANVGLIFALGLLMSYGNYFSRRYRYQFRWVRPVFTALGLVFGLWIFAEIMMIVAVNMNIEILDTISTILSTYLGVIFIVVLVIGYVVFLVTFLGVVSEAKIKEETARRSQGHQYPPWDGYRRLYRSGRSRILGGVCGGLGEYANLDPNLIRVIWIILLVVSMGIAIIAYILMWILIPRNPRDMWR